jgi:acetate kinase
MDAMVVATAVALHVLALNSGSSSLKFGLYRADDSGTEALMTGEAESIGGNDSKFQATDPHGKTLVSKTESISNQHEAVARVSRVLAAAKTPVPDAVGHRIVHGGPKLRRHRLIDDEVLAELEAATAFAPLHIPPALDVIRFAEKNFPGTPQIACFDTAFHAEMPDVARVLAIPNEWKAKGIQRYGFHGLSCESIVSQLGAPLSERLIIAHLGNGASITAVRSGKSVDTSMGLTPTGGVIMGTRSGDLDPGVLVYLAREKNYDAAMLEKLVDRQSGLLGISGVASDMRYLHEVGTANADSRLAIDMFCYSASKQIAAMIAVLGGIDTIVFTGGIGENDVEVRSRICARLSWAGINLDETRNRSAANPISTVNSLTEVRVLPSQEDKQIARHTASLLADIPGQ